MSTMTPPIPPTATPATPRLQPAFPTRPPISPRRAQPYQRRPDRSRVGLVVIMIVSLLGAGFFQQWASSEQHSHAVIGEGAGAAPLSRMNSFAMSLLLGGLRGPLVMLLWTSSESQKRDKDLDDFDTKVEWIRLLQPEFDSVHIFQIWNKAYNISVLKASLQNKYLTILDALDYAHKVDRERPDDINIIFEMGRVFFDKLGQSQEKAFYNSHVRAETLPHKLRQRLKPDDPAWRPLELNPMLDANGFILPEYLAPSKTRLVNPTDPSEFYDGSQLQFLAKYQPFPDGISPLAIGFNYQRRASLLQELAHEKHAQLSESVVDDRAPLTLEFWAAEELERGRRAELAALSEPVPTERLALEPPRQGATEPITDATERQNLAHAQQEYALSSRVADDSLHEYQRHILRYRNNFATSESHMEGVNAQSALAAGDRDYLGAMLASGEDRRHLFESAAAEYRVAADRDEVILFQYYLSDEGAEQILPKGYNRVNVVSLDPRYFDQILEAYKRITFTPSGRTEFSDDASEFVGYVSRAQSRMIQIQTQLKSPIK